MALTVDERQLDTTGRHLDRLDFYSGNAMMVKVDPKTRKGSVK